MRKNERNFIIGEALFFGVLFALNVFVIDVTVDGEANSAASVFGAFIWSAGIWTTINALMAATLAFIDWTGRAYANYLSRPRQDNGGGE